MNECLIKESKRDEYKDTKQFPCEILFCDPLFTEERPTLFSRKFIALINQDVKIGEFISLVLRKIEAFRDCKDVKNKNVFSILGLPYDDFSEHDHMKHFTGAFRNKWDVLYTANTDFFDKK